MATHEHTGDIKKGGFFVHYRDNYRRCDHAFVAARVAGTTLNLQVIPNAPEQLMWRPKTTHGAGKGQWHWPDQCGMTDEQIKADEKPVDKMQEFIEAGRPIAGDAVTDSAKTMVPAESD